MLKHFIAVATAPFQLPVRQAIAAASSTGAQGVQFDARTELCSKDLGETARRQLLHYLSERGLKLASLAFPLKHSLAAPEYLDARVEGIRDAMSFTRDLKANSLIVPLGGVPAQDDTRTTEVLQQILRDLAAHGNHVGVTLCLTTAGDSFSRLKQLLDDITTGPLGIEFDPAGSVLMRQSPAEPLRTLYPYLRHVQIRDALRDSTGFGKEVPVGRGEVDWDELAAVLYEIEFKGWLTVLRTSGDDRQGDAKRAVSFLTNLLPG